ncbi:MAG TPA: hypothetical protein VE547_08475, partial [Mycobacteriales bacterium]|nr:hypothetical protein [Mycobacteriales bacterium]
VTHTPRRLVGVLALPILLGVALAAGPIGDRPPDGGGGVLAGGPTAAPPASPTGPRSTVFPGTTGPPTPVAPRPTPTLAAAQRAAAVDYVTTANTHDARPGRDRGFIDSYRRTRAYVTPELYALVTAPSRRGDYQWSQWTAAQATVRVEVVAVGVPDGAPAPTDTTAYARVQFRQVVTPTTGASAEQVTDGAVSLLVTRTGTRWLVSELLADT